MSHKKYFAVVNASIQSSIAYRSMFISNLLFNFIYIFAYYFLWKAIFIGNSELSGFNWEQMKSYLLITFVLNNFLSLRSEYQISRKIMNGSIVFDLLRPLSFQRFCLMETLGASIFEGFFSALFIGFSLKMIFDITIPVHLITWVLFTISLILSICVRYSINYCFSLLCFWTTSMTGVVTLRTAVTNLFSGFLIPLSFFPGWLRTISDLLPFQTLVYIPATIFIQKTPMHSVIYALILQAVWFILLWFVGKWIWHFASRQITISGG